MWESDLQPRLRTAARAGSIWARLLGPPWAEGRHIYRRGPAAPLQEHELTVWATSASHHAAEEQSHNSPHFSYAAPIKLLPSSFSHQSPTWPGTFLGLLSNVCSLQDWRVVVVLAKRHPHSCCSSLTCTRPTSTLPTACAEQALHAQVLCSAHKQVFFHAWWDATFSEVGP